MSLSLWSTVLTLALKVLTLVLDAVEKRSAEKQVVLTEKQQVHYGKVVNSINKAERNANSNAATSSVSERAEAIDKIIDS